jgi:formylglycine-generating enzyme required for sulfatase activity
MKTLKLAFLLGLTLAVSSRAQETRFFRISGPVATSITAFRTDGTMVWTNAPTNTTFTVQTATSLLGESNWVDYVQIPVTNGVNTNRLIDFNPPSGMVLIPAGSFTMGSPASEAGRISAEVQHTVTLTKGFYMGKYPVTQGQYLAVVGSNPSYFKTNDWNGNPISPDLNRPVETVSWNDATNYCALLTQSDRVAGRIPFNWAYRLPTEAEREYACRAGTTTAFHFGSAIHGGMANFYDYYEYDAAIGVIYVVPSVPWLHRTTTVGSYAPNAFGLYDMHGNVWEWCQDWYGSYPSGAVVDPTGPASGSNRVLRGGGWFSRGGDCRSARRSDIPTDWDSRVGFRVVLAPGQP